MKLLPTPKGIPRDKENKLVMILILLFLIIIIFLAWPLFGY